jgi:voltage-gated potassium channel Kch
MALLDTLHDAFHRPRTRAHVVTDRAVYAVIVLSIAVLGLELLLTEGVWYERLLWLDHVLLGVFALELVLRVATLRPAELSVFHRPPLGVVRVHLVARLRFLLTPSILVDLVTVLAVVPALRGLRVVRLFRLARIERLFRYANPFEGLVAALRADRVLFAFGLTLLGTLTLVGGVSLFLVERGQNPQIADVGDGIWWALVTLTTVGFGDITPATGVGRSIGGVLMVGGMFTLALFAGIVGHSLLHAVLSIREEQFRMSDYVEHIIVCGYEEGDSLLLTALADDIDLSVNRVVLFAPGERPMDLPPAFLWVRGDPTKASELDKVRLSHARTVIISGERRIAPQLADAKTILITFTVRSYMKRLAEHSERIRALYVVTEVLDSENVEHARAAGADEVIETRRVGASLLAHSVAYPGVANAAGRLVTKGAQNLYAGRNLGPQQLFSEAQDALSQQHGAMLIGVIDPDSGDETLNPGQDFIVTPAHRLLYLAPTPVAELS